MSYILKYVPSKSEQRVALQVYEDFPPGFPYDGDGEYIDGPDVLC
jgi:hypothetical protein